ncbi:MAG: flagellar basal body rod protein FlgC [Planctomycetales bacterium]|nr:flagellar basal body rod protein FlgC [Planctomycetales bacterium]
MGFDTALGALNVSASGLNAERLRMEIVANNIANASATRTPNGGPFRRQDIVFETVLNGSGTVNGSWPEAQKLGGVRAVEIVEDQSEMPRVLNPGHPDADADGFVTMPNVNLPIEMVNLITATRAYEANLRAAQSFLEMSQQALSLVRG